jgi:hypothetical protein
MGSPNAIKSTIFLAIVGAMLPVRAEVNSLLTKSHYSEGLATLYRLSKVD